MLGGILHAQEKGKTGYTNFQDTVFAIKDVVVEAEQTKKVKALILDVPLKFMPQSANILSGKILEERGIQNIEEALRFIPGVKMQTTYGAFHQLSIRGFDKSIVMIDGVRDERSGIDNSYPFADLSNVESMELIKGPSSVLCGQGAVGGVLNVTRKQPTDKQTVNARMSVGSWDYRQTFLGLGGKLAGPFKYYASINYVDGDGWRDNLTKRLSVYAAVSADLGKRDELEFRGGFNNDDYGTETGIPYPTYDVYNLDGSLYAEGGRVVPGSNRKARYNNETDFMKNNAWNISAQYTHTFGKDTKLMDKFSYMYDDINYFNTEELTYLTSSDPIYNHYYERNGNKTYICMDSVARTYPLRFSHIAKSYCNQLELSGKLMTGQVKHNYLVGYSMFLLRRVSYSGYSFGDGVESPDLIGAGLFSVTPVDNPYSGGPIQSRFSRASIHRRDMHGFYLQDLVELNDHWKVLLSGRYDLYKRRTASTDAKDRGRDYDEPEESAFSTVKSDAFTYRAGVVYLPIPSLSLYASVGSYFKPNNNTYSATTIYVNRHGETFDPGETNEVFEPEHGAQYEFGFRYDWKDKLSVNASVYYIDKKNKVETLGRTTIDGKSRSVVGQIGEMDSRGFDIDVTYTPLPGMTFASGYAFTNARYRKFAESEYTQLLSLKPGMQFAYIPRNTFYVLGDYIVQKGPLRNLGCNLSISFQDDTYMNAANTLKLDDYWMTDLGLSYKLPNNVRISLAVKNLFNVHYYASMTPNYVPGASRNWLMSLAYSF